MDQRMMRKKRQPNPADLYKKGNYEDLVRDILIDFSCLYDTDLGCMYFMMKNYSNSAYIIPEAKGWTEYFAKCKLVTREKINPLTILLKEEYIDQADNLYQEIFTDHWEEVLNLTSKTDVLDLVYGTFEYAGYNITINCRNELEEQFIKKNIPKWNTVIDKKYVDKFFCVFIHDLDKSLSYLEPLVGKCIYIYYHKPNFLNYKQKVPNITLAPYSLSNEFRIIDPYSKLTLPYDMTENDLEVNEHGKEYRAK